MALESTVENGVSEGESESRVEVGIGKISLSKSHGFQSHSDKNKTCIIP